MLTSLLPSFSRASSYGTYPDIYKPVFASVPDRKRFLATLLLPGLQSATRQIPLELLIYLSFLLVFLFCSLQTIPPTWTPTSTSGIEQIEKRTPIIQHAGHHTTRP